LNAGLEMPTQPVEKQASMPALALAAHLANGDMALPQGLQTMLFFLQERISQHPKVQNGSGTQQLTVIQAQLLLARASGDGHWH
jgi:hypothetical protein